MARELTGRAKEIADKLEAMGITLDTRPGMFRSGIETNSLPKSGKFKFDENKHIAGEEVDGNDYRHLRIGVEGSDLHSVSTSAIKISALQKGEPSFRKSEREGSDYYGSYFLQGQTLNPQLAKFSDIELVAFLDGKSFTAQEVDVKQLPFKAAPGWEEEPTAADLVTKKVYKINVQE